MTDISAILNLHAEGLLAHASLVSIRQARKVAEEAGLSVEVIVVVDSPDDATTSYVSGIDDAQVLPVRLRDLGLARNQGIAVANGRHVAFLDGDDLWGPNWLLAAHHAALSEPRPTVWHPEASLVFGAGIQATWTRHPDIEEAEGDWTTLGVRNHWSALSFAARDTYVEVPYSAVDLQAGLGYEDWSWNEETVARGYLHKPVASTAHMVRIRGNSLVRQTFGAAAIKVPSTLFISRIGWTAKIGAAPAVAFCSETGHEHQNAD